MNVLIYVFEEINWPTHTLAILDIIEAHKNKGDSVTVLTCDRQLLTCRQRTDKNKSTCDLCCKNSDSVLREFFPGVQKRGFINLFDKDRLTLEKLKTKFDSWEDLNEYVYQDFEIGNAVTAHLWDILNEEKPVPKDNEILIKKCLISSMEAYLSCCNEIKTNKIDIAYVFNGRWTWTRAVFRACTNLGVLCRLHERGSEFKKYELFDGVLPQDIKTGTNRIRELWEIGEKQNREQRGEEWYLRRMKGDSLNWISYVGNQEQVLPRYLNDHDSIASIFLTSQFEFASADPKYRWCLGGEQLEGIRQIIPILKAKFDKVIIRCHPNQIFDKTVTKYYALAKEGVFIEKPESKISSYKLIGRSNLVVTFGSTVGIEAAFLGRPAALCATAAYQELGSCYLVKSADELRAILATDLKALPKDGALMFGYYNIECGIPVKEFSFDNSEITGLGKVVKIQGHSYTIFQRIINHIKIFFNVGYTNMYTFGNRRRTFLEVVLSGLRLGRK